jgi:hypothetical protein
MCSTHPYTHIRFTNTLAYFATATVKNVFSFDMPKSHNSNICELGLPLWKDALRYSTHAFKNVKLANTLAYFATYTVKNVSCLV